MIWLSALFALGTLPVYFYPGSWTATIVSGIGSFHFFLSPSSLLWQLLPSFGNRRRLLDMIGATTPSLTIELSTRYLSPFSRISHSFSMMSDATVRRKVSVRSGGNTLTTSITSSPTRKNSTLTFNIYLFWPSQKSCFT